MKALLFDEGLRLVDVPSPRPSPGEALIKVSLAGICNTDLEITQGYMGFRGIIGHEFVGIVEGCREESWIGRRVVGEINIGCGECEYCRSGLDRHCPHRTVMGIQNRDGAFAEYLTLPVKNLHPVPEEVSDERAVFTEPLAAALEILEQVQIKPDDRVSVIGDGKLGLLVAQVLRLTGCELTCIGKHPNKLKILNSKGIKTLFAGDINGLPKQDVIVECSGSPEGLISALNLIKPRGKVILKSTYHQGIEFNPAKIVIDEIDLVGSRCGQFGPAIRYLHRNLVDVESLITRIFPFEKALEAFEFSKRREVLKVLLDFR